MKKESTGYVSYDELINSKFDKEINKFYKYRQKGCHRNITIKPNGRPHEVSWASAFHSQSQTLCVCRDSNMGSRRDL